jgi:hypothetical protein
MRSFVPLLLFAAAPALAQHQGHDQSPPPPPPADHSGHQMPNAQPQEEPAEHGGHMGTCGIEVMCSPVPGALGRHPMRREASGTSWQPDASIHSGLHARVGDWELMGHATLNGVYDWQQGPRGADEGFVSGMIMGSALHHFTGGSGGVLQFRAMLSPDALMGRRGYPLHLAAGESADGVTPLVDRQHPHDFVMELSASYSRWIGGDYYAFVYAGLPGEPAFGPPAFMHRMSIMDSPEAPISHHWLDSTHISFGVVTAGVILVNFKAEISRFNGREPDQHRWNIETGPLDSTAARLSWNPDRNLSLQASWAHLVSPEQLEPGENSTRWSASAIYTRPLGQNSWWSSTLAWGNRDGDNAFVLESAAGLGPWTLFGRAELTQNDELTFAGGHHGPRYTVGKVSAGAIRDFRVSPHLRLGLGAQYALNFVPSPLEALYGGDPDGAMAFIRLRLD